MSNTSLSLEKDPELAKSPHGAHAYVDELAPSKTSIFQEEAEVFTGGEGAVNFRTVGWIRTSIFFIKMTFAVGVLSIPSALYAIGMGAGLVALVVYGSLNTYMALVFGKFKNAHPRMHSVSDGAEILAIGWGFSARTASIVREAVEALYIFTCCICGGASMLALGTALNAVSKHATCTVAFNVVALVLITGVASIRKVSHLTWVTWVGFFSIVVAVMIVVIAVTIPDRPAAAPQTGDFDLGFSFLPAPGVDFLTGFGASLGIFASSGNTCAFVPVISEMKSPKDYKKSIYLCMTWINTSFICFTTIIFYYCGKWVASPALGSAGPTIKIIAYAIAIPGLVAGAMVWTHVSAKTVFVRVLRNSRHLTADTPTHWIVWFACCWGLGTCQFLLAEVIPFFNQLISLSASLCFGPLCVILPTLMWFGINKQPWSERSVENKALWILHAFFIVLGLFITIAGTTGNIKSIVQAFQDGTVSGVFSCADNSGSV